MKFDVKKHIVFEQVEKKAKTSVYQVHNTQQGCVIGIVKWHPAWRHYCFFPEYDTVFSDRCLIRIGELVEKLNKEHKQ